MLNTVGELDKDYNRNKKFRPLFCPRDDRRAIKDKQIEEGMSSSRTLSLLISLG